MTRAAPAPERFGRWICSRGGRFKEVRGYRATDRIHLTIRQRTGLQVAPRGTPEATCRTHLWKVNMQPGSVESTETFQALDAGGTVYTIQVQAEMISLEKPDGSVEQTFGSKIFKTADDHPVTLHDDGSFEDMVTRVIMHRIESP